jgi:asparagine synthase (glutamine-hydrolysing)
MCGIAGFISNLSPAIGASVLSAMCDKMLHRGPDEVGMQNRGCVYLGMRRLSIIDVAGGQQPIENEDGSLIIVFNGEIYNFQDLRKVLANRGHKFKTNSDTEVILHAYEEYGSACLEQLRGMFAFAIWNANTDTLFIARDRLGKKPLYYTLTSSGSFVFGSELKVLLQHPDVKTEVNANAVVQYLSLGYVPDPHTIYKSIYKLPPAHFLKYADHEVSISEYWDIPVPQYDVTLNDSAILERLQDEIQTAVRLRMISEVPIGAFLSGGIDSATVVAHMARFSNRPIKTFSIGFEEAEWNELPYAKLTAEKYRTDHTEFVVKPDVCSLVEQIARYLDEPFADSSALPSFIVSQLARQHVTVALTGDGGDELFAGYERYGRFMTTIAIDRVPTPLRRLLRVLASRLPHHAPGKHFLDSLALPGYKRYLNEIAPFGELSRALVLENPSDIDSLPSTTIERALERWKTDPLDALQYLDCKSYLAGDILTKMDRMSMANSLEVRSPLLDHRLFEFVASIPSSYKKRNGIAKWMLRTVGEPILPSELFSVPKHGFAVPLELWINRDLREMMRDTLLSSACRSRGIIDSRYVEVLLDEHSRRRRDHSTKLWALFMLELWFSTVCSDRSPNKSFALA